MYGQKINREKWLVGGLIELRKYFKGLGYDVPKLVRVSVGFPKGNKRFIGQCYNPVCSKDKNNEIFISPVLDDKLEVLAVLVHELVHTVVGTEVGHRAPFKRCAVSVGLEGKMTSTNATKILLSYLRKLARQLGKYPHARLNQPTKKDSTRLIKLVCPDCGYIVRTTRKWADIGLPLCYCGGEFQERS